MSVYSRRLIAYTALLILSCWQASGKSNFSNPHLGKFFAPSISYVFIVVLHFLNTDVSNPFGFEIHHNLMSWRFGKVWFLTDRNIFTKEIFNSTGWSNEIRHLHDLVSNVVLLSWRTEFIIYKYILKVSKTDFIMVWRMFTATAFNSTELNSTSETKSCKSRPSVEHDVWNGLSHPPEKNAWDVKTVIA